MRNGRRCHLGLVDTLGTTLPAFVLFEEQLMRLIPGIRLPRPAAVEQ